MSAFQKATSASTGDSAAEIKNELLGRAQMKMLIAFEISL